MDDENSQSAPPIETPTLEPELAPLDPTSEPVTEEPVETEPAQTVTPIEPAPEQSEPQPVQETPFQSQSAPAAPTPQAPQPQSPAQQDQTGFIRALLAKANARLGLNRQKKLDKLMLLAQKKGFVTNEDTQDLLHCSDATATRYLVKLVQQGRLSRESSSHWVKYRFIR